MTRPQENQPQEQIVSCIANCLASLERGKLLVVKSDKDYEYAPLAPCPELNLLGQEEVNSPDIFTGRLDIIYLGKNLREVYARAFRLYGPVQAAQFRDFYAKDYSFIESIRDQDFKVLYKRAGESVPKSRSIR